MPFTGPSRSSRAASDSCSVVGTKLASASAEGRLPSPSAPAASQIARVSSSAKSGTPSVRLSTCSTIAAGSPPRPATRSTRRSVCRRVRRRRARRVTCSSPAHAGLVPGRAVATTSTGAPAAWRTSASSTSSLEGSSQCRSSTTSSTGLRAEAASTSCNSASSVFCLRFCGVSSSGERASSGGSDSASVSSATVSGVAPTGSSARASRSRFWSGVCDSSSRASRDSISITGCSAWPVW